MYSLSYEFLIAQCSPLLSGCALGDDDDDDDKKDDGFVHTSFFRASMISIITIIYRMEKKMILKSMIKKSVWLVCFYVCVFCFKFIYLQFLAYFFEKFSIFLLHSLNRHCREIEYTRMFYP